MSASVTIETFNPPMLELFWTFVRERQLVWHRRHVECLPPPWTEDETLRTQRFTNIYRELDPGTQYVIHHVLNLDEPAPDRIFNVMMYRLIGRAETHAALGFQRLDTFSPEHMSQTLAHIRDVESKPPFTAAYMVSAYTNMGSRDKITNVTRLFTRLRDNFSQLYTRIEQASSLEQIHLALSKEQGFGNFLAYQTLVDLLYPLPMYGGRPLLPFSHDDWASAGPGAQRGVRLLLLPGARAEYLDIMRWLRVHQRAEFQRLGLDFPFLQAANGSEIEISLANIQNCLCEYHKYVKIRAGTGRARRRYNAAGAGDQGQTPAPSKRRGRKPGKPKPTNALQPSLFGA
jgi:5-hmdU DNA kinase-like protein